MFFRKVAENEEVVLNSSGGNRVIVNVAQLFLSYVLCSIDANILHMDLCNVVVQLVVFFFNQQIPVFIEKIFRFLSGTFFQWNLLECLVYSKLVKHFASPKEKKILSILSIAPECLTLMYSCCSKLLQKPISPVSSEP